MIQEYIVLLNETYYIDVFQQYLTKVNIIYEVLPDIKQFIVKCTSDQAKAIGQIHYIISVVENTSYTSELILDKRQGTSYAKKVEIRTGQVRKYPDDEYGNWGIDRMFIPCIWQQGYTGKGVKIAVLDTGYQPHERLKVVESVSFVPGESPLDQEGHGTAVLGELGVRYPEAKIVGVAFDAELYSAKVIGKLGKIDLAALMKALNWCGEKKVDIINLSIGIMESLDAFTKQAIDVAIQNLIGKGIAVVASTGNDGLNRMSFFAQIRGVYAIGASDKADKRCSFSNYGKGIFGVAPGKEIITTGLNNQYVQETGTSFATPQVSGLIALIKSSGFKGDIRQLLINTAKPIGGGYNQEYGYGIIQAPKPSLIGGIVNSRRVYPYGTQNELIYLAKDIESQSLTNVEVDFLITTPSNKRIITAGKTNEEGEIRIGINTDSTVSSAEGSDILLDEIGTYQVETVARKACQSDLILPDQINVVKNTMNLIVICKNFITCNKYNLEIIIFVKDKIGRGVANVNTQLIQKGCCTSYVVGSATSNKEGISYLKAFIPYYCIYENLEIKASKAGYEIAYISVK